MDLTAVSEKLNNIISENPDAKSGAGLYFLSGDFFDTVSELCLRLAPQGKCAFICLDSTAVNLGGKITASVKSAGGKLFTVSEKKCFGVESKECAGLFNLPEDIRLVICVDSALFPAVSYFATVRGLPFVKLINPRDIGGLFTALAGGYRISCEEYAIIPETVKKSDAPYLYGYAMAKLVTLIDYRFDFKIRNRKINSYSYGLAKNAVTSVFSLSKDAVKVDLAALLCDALTLAVSDRIADGELFGYGCPEEILRLISASADSRSKFLFWSAIKAIGVYDAAAKSSIGEVPDYNARAETLANTYGQSEEDALKQFKIQIAFFKNNRREIDAFAKKISPEITSYNNLTESLVSRYLALGGGYLSEKENDAINGALKYAGDGKFNFTSYARERGITEII